MSGDNLKRAIQRQFGGSAEAYVVSTVHAEQNDLQQMVQLARLQGDEMVLDIATGGGHTALAFAPHVRHVVASDLTEQMLEAAERFIKAHSVDNVRFDIADAEALPYDAHSFDVVTCRVAAHHFAAFENFVSEVARVLQVGGRFLLVDTISPPERDLDIFINTLERLRDPTHVRDYTASEWTEACTSAGLQITHTSTFTKTIPFIDWCTRARVIPSVQKQLQQMLSEAPPKIVEAFAIKVEAEVVQSFALHSILLVAEKLATT